MLQSLGNIKRLSLAHKEVIFFYITKGHGTGGACPEEELWLPHPRECSRPGWMRLVQEPGLLAECGMGRALRPLPPQTIQGVIPSSSLQLLKMSITKIHAREIFDSRGNPTVEVDLYTNKGESSAAGVHPCSQKSAACPVPAVQLC